MSDDEVEKYYRPRMANGTLDERDERLLAKIFAIAAQMHTFKEAAALLAVSKSSFEKFMVASRVAREAWEDGKNVGRAGFRKMGMRHALADPTTWRFLSKQKRYLAMEDKPADEAATGGQVIISVDEARARVIELYAKITIDAAARPQSTPGQQRLVAKPASKVGKSK